MMLRRWFRKFEIAFRGIGCGMRGQDSFFVHIPMAATVLLMAAVLRVKTWEWCVLVLCIGAVISAELFNSAIERLVRRLHPDRHDDIRIALDTAAGAVLVASITAAIIGLLTLGRALLVFFGVWGNL